MPRTPALDGLRALAIAAVALFHYPTHSVFRGGLFGVGIFFVLSGFLITPILTSEQARTGRVDLRRYVSRRAWRLLPALVAFLVFVVVMAAAFGRDGWFTSSPFGPPHAAGAPLSGGTAALSSLAALGYVYNFFLAFTVHMPQPFGHLWTLAVEGQFYLAWALAVPWLLRRGARTLILTTAGLIGASAVMPFLVWDHGAGANWIYFGTVPRLQQLLAGALLAELWSRGFVARIPRSLLALGAGAAAGTMCWMVLEVGNVGLKYLGGTTVVAACGFLIVAHLVDDRGRGISRRVLSCRPMVWLGRRSYGIYLWHWPLALWTNQLPHDVGVPLGLGCSVVAAELSWRLVERPAQLLARRRERREEAPEPSASLAA